MAVYHTDYSDQTAARLDRDPEAVARLAAAHRSKHVQQTPTKITNKDKPPTVSSVATKREER